jgi:hypothetical protein
MTQNINFKTISGETQNYDLFKKILKKCITAYLVILSLSTYFPDFTEFGDICTHRPSFSWSCAGIKT